MMAENGHAPTIHITLTSELFVPNTVCQESHPEIWPFHNEYYLRPTSKCGRFTFRSWLLLGNRSFHIYIVPFSAQ